MIITKFVASIKLIAFMCYILQSCIHDFADDLTRTHVIKNFFVQDDELLIVQHIVPCFLWYYYIFLGVKLPK